MWILDSRTGQAEFAELLRSRSDATGCIAFLDEDGIKMVRRLAAPRASRLQVVLRHRHQHKHESEEGQDSR